MSSWSTVLPAWKVYRALLKYSEGMSRLFPTIVMYASGFASFYFLSGAVERIPIGTAYAVWTGIGAIGTAMIGMLLFGESAHWLRLLSMHFSLAAG